MKKVILLLIIFTKVSTNSSFAVFEEIDFQEIILESRVCQKRSKIIRLPELSKIFKAKSVTTSEGKYEIRLPQESLESYKKQLIQSSIQIEEVKIDNETTLSMKYTFEHPYDKTIILIDEIFFFKIKQPLSVVFFKNTGFAVAYKKTLSATSKPEAYQKRIEEITLPELKEIIDIGFVTTSEGKYKIQESQKVLEGFSRTSYFDIYVEEVKDKNGNNLSITFSFLAPYGQSLKMSDKFLFEKVETYKR